MGIFGMLMMPLIYPTFEYDRTTEKLMGVFLYILFDILAVVAFVFYLFPKYFPQSKFLRLIVGLFVVLALQYVLRDIVFWILLGDQLTIFTTRRFVFGIINNAQNLGVFMAILIAKQFYETQNEMLALQKAQKENELRWLKSQIDPHFLFNNLNILDILINTDPKKASVYTRKLSALYRYLVRQKDQDVVSLAEEWNFASDYIFLLKQRFNKLFVFEDNLNGVDLDLYFIPPASLQIVLENAVKHNIADDEHPIRVKIQLEGDFLVITNTFRPKKIKPIGTNTGLENLQARIRLLTDQSIKVTRENGLFEVWIPLVRQVASA